MQRRTIFTGGSLAVVALLMAGAGTAEPASRLSGPFVHENLAVYLIHGPSQPGPTPLTLAEAMAKGIVKVHETRDVNRLQIENLGKSDVFIQSGDIVKGGQQDRVLTVSLMLAGGSGRVPIDAFCVEQGRWSARGNEDVRQFASADSVVPSRQIKLAIRSIAPAAANRGSDVARRQQEVWRGVEDTQAALTNAIGQPVAAPVSRSSLQLAIENGTLATTRAAYVKALRPIAEQEPDVVGYVVAVNGRMNGAEAYATNGLFRKMWPKLLDASATEALGARGDGAATAPPTLADAEAFLAAAEGGRRATRPLPTQGDVVTRDGDRAVFVETSTKSGAWFHRSYVAK
ncbi:MAG: hypothetical protein JNK67_21510 [Alphaproteobacteria bacterium]|nr:hypothetical protein [Alphaproteobacteria bacterium]